MKVEEVKQITNKALEELAASLETGHSEALTAYLETMALFSKYSLNNLFLIARQRPDARRVAGFQTWRKLGRFVRKGEKGIAIIAPLIRRKSKWKVWNQPKTNPSLAVLRSLMCSPKSKPRVSLCRKLAA